MGALSLGAIEKAGAIGAVRLHSERGIFLARSPMGERLSFLLALVAVAAALPVRGAAAADPGRS